MALQNTATTHLPSSPFTPLSHPAHFSTTSKRKPCHIRFHKQKPAQGQLHPYDKWGYSKYRNHGG